jgi:hypothetical protein
MKANNCIEPNSALPADETALMMMLTMMMVMVMMVMMMDDI